MRRDICDLNPIRSRFQFQRKVLSHHSKSLVVDGERRRIARLSWFFLGQTPTDEKQSAHKKGPHCSLLNPDYLILGFPVLRNRNYCKQGTRAACFLAVPAADTRGAKNRGRRLDPAA